MKFVNDNYIRKYMIIILDYLYYNRQHNTFLMYNLLMFYQYSYATCFDHNFGHHQALNEHISSNQTH
jgi:hypothetical protein